MKYSWTNFQYNNPLAWSDGYDWYLEIVFEGDVIWHLFGYNDYPDTYVHLAYEIRDITQMDLLEINTIDEKDIKLFERYGNPKLD